ncbi:tetratricopeptide repeat protein [Trinickia acidisoli]|uniref:tetratricopeptide repeat protein n=1 Tax=Trinickia acidisoli TaxID=2767482 RepID=UPI001A8FFA65|nr:tetratricopeptide repeat protein [Trinickia acidisoli]
MKTFLAAVGAALLFVSSAAFAVPSTNQVEHAMAQGNWQQADAELSQVIAAHPNNAHAHYLYGQVLENEGRYADALAQVEQAKTLDPQIRFTRPDRFAQVEARLRTAAQHAGATAATAHGAANSLVQTLPTAPTRHGPSMAAWIGLAILIIAVVLILRWTLRRARSNDDGRADEERRAQLKRVTELLNAARSLKLDARLSSAPGHETLASEVENVENQLRALVEALSNNGNPVPAYQIDDLARQIDSLRARAEGRPDPNAQAPGAAPSAYAQEAERLQQQAPYGMQQPYPQQQPVIVQQGGGGMGGLLTGVLLGEALSHGRDRVVERDVYVDDDEARRRAAEGGNGGGLDFGQGSSDWNDNGGSDGNVDFGNDDSGGWSDN